MNDYFIPKTPATACKTIRFPIDVIDQIEETIYGQDWTFTAFVVNAVKIILKEIEKEKAGK